MPQERREADDAAAIDYLIVGGGPAGATAADILRRGGAAGSVTILSADDLAPYHRQRLSKGYLVGDSFSAADVGAIVHLPAVRRILGTVLKEDPLAELPGLAEYLARMDARATVQKIHADQAANFPEFVAYLRARYALPPQ